MKGSTIVTTIPPSSAGRPGPVPAAQEQTVSASKPPTAPAAPAPPGDDFNRASTSPFSEAALGLKAGKASHGLQPFLRHRGVPSDTAPAAGTGRSPEDQSTVSNLGAPALERLGEPDARPGSTEPLAKLLASMFTDNESLKQLVYFMGPDGESIARNLPGLSVSQEKMAHAVAEKLATDVPRDQLLDGLSRERPLRRDEIVAALAELGAPAAVGDSPKAAGPKTAQEGLRDLLLELFSAESLRQFIAFLPGDVELGDDLPGDEASDLAIAEAASELLLRNFPREAISEQLVEERPMRRDEIARRIGGLGELAPPRPAGERPASPQQQALQRLLCSVFVSPADLNVFLKRIPGSQEWIEKLLDGSATMNQSATVASRLLQANVDPKLLALKMIEEAPGRRQDIVNALGVKLGDEPPPPPTVEQEFNSLLCSLFPEPIELRMFLRFLGDGELGQKIPGADLSMRRMADATATLLLAEADPAAVRDQLVELRPGRRDEIEAFFRRVTNAG
jgi:hypothetical protein